MGKRTVAAISIRQAQSNSVPAKRGVADSCTNMRKVETSWERTEGEKSNQKAIYGNNWQHHHQPGRCQKVLKESHSVSKTSLQETVRFICHGSAPCHHHVVPHQASKVTTPTESRCCRRPLERKTRTTENGKRFRHMHAQAF